MNSDSIMFLLVITGLPFLFGVVIGVSIGVSIGKDIPVDANQIQACQTICESNEGMRSIVYETCVCNNKGEFYIPRGGSNK